MEQARPEPPPYIYIESNEFSYRKHKKQKEEDVAICECQYDATDPGSACAERCLNVLTSTECTPGYCLCGVYCKNQRFQKCEYAKTWLVKTEGRGWGLLADENIKAGQFIIEYCGEVISWKEAKRRSQAYETQGLKDAYIIYLNADESIDATRKGSLARFINHSCHPNCETRKWTVLGEVRVGIFAKQDIPIGTELSYDYNFEWFGGAIVRCLCGAASCSGFLGAKSRGFQEAAYLWEDDDDRYSVENVPLYDSADDEPTSISKVIILTKGETIAQEGNGNTFRSTITLGSTDSTELVPMTVEPLNSVPMGVDFVENGAAGYGVQYAHGAPQNFTQKIANTQSNDPQNSRTELTVVKCSTQFPGGKAKRAARKQLNVLDICDRLAFAEAREEILYCEEAKKQATANINVLYDEIRPAVEEHERDSQDSVSTSLAEKWIEASCCKYKADFDLYAAIIKNIACGPLRAKEDAIPREENGFKYLENGP